LEGVHVRDDLTVVDPFDLLSVSEGVVSSVAGALKRVLAEVEDIVTSIVKHTPSNVVSIRIRQCTHIKVLIGPVVIEDTVIRPVCIS